MKRNSVSNILMNRLRSLWADERGQSTTEYILILSVVVMIAMKFKQTFSAKLLSTLQQISGQMDQVTDPNQ